MWGRHSQDLSVRASGAGIHILLAIAIINSIQTLQLRAFALSFDQRVLHTHLRRLLAANRAGMAAAAQLRIWQPQTAEDTIENS